LVLFWKAMMFEWAQPVALGPVSFELEKVKL